MPGVVGKHLCHVFQSYDRKVPIASMHGKLSMSLPWTVTGACKARALSKEKCLHRVLKSACREAAYVCTISEVKDYFCLVKLQFIYLLNLLHCSVKLPVSFF